MKNPTAVALGRMAKGVKKQYSPAEIKRRTKLLEAVNKKRAGKIRLASHSKAMRSAEKVLEQHRSVFQRLA